MNFGHPMRLQPTVEEAAMVCSLIITMHMWLLRNPDIA
jgi:hypothetical protein